MLSRMLGTLAAKAVAAAVIAAAATGGLAVAGALPAPVQQGVADVAGQVGVDLARPGGATPATQPAPAIEPAPPSARSSADLPQVDVPQVHQAPATAEAPHAREAVEPTESVEPTEPAEAPEGGD